MQRQIFTFMLTIFVLVAACQPIQPFVRSPAAPTLIPPPELTGMPIERWSSTAPNEQWQAAGLVAFPQSGSGEYYTELRVKKVDGSTEWTPVTAWNEWGLGYTTPRPLQWSPDGRYLYFTNAPVPDGCGILINGSDLQRLDLSDGSVLEVLPPNSTWSLAVAPDGKTVAYSHHDELYLLTLATGDYSATKLEMLDTNSAWGSIVWSPDSQRLAFTVAYERCMTPQWRQSIIVMDLPSLMLTTLIEKDERLLTTHQWLDDDHIQLHDHEGKIWEMDVITGSTTPGE
jgi:dipeptidyl aminopeptidase/acylaminoacyl peptidase